MAIDRDLWSEVFTKDDVPSYPCPSCRKGYLKINIKQFIIEETSESKRDRHDDNWEPDWINESYSGKLVCQNAKCKESVFVVGKQRPGTDYSNDSLEYISKYYPKYFLPTLHIFKIAEEVPWEVEEAIIDAFKIFWSDKAACANGIRKVVETILDDHRIRKTKEGSKRKVRLMPHERIQLFKAKHKSGAKTLEAIKWIGNAGSHVTEIEEEILFDGLDLLEFALEEIYVESHYHKMVALRDKINIKKKP